MSNPPRFISFKQDLIRIVIEQEAKDGSVLIFPTDAAKKEALRIHRQNWQFEDIRFLSMDEMKSCLFLPSNPVVREEKRALLLFQALDEQIRSHFNIRTYFQSVDLANKFFQFFEELNDEMINPDTLLSVLEKEDADLQEWQIETYNNLLELRKRYADILKSKGFEDTIFTNRAENLQLDLLDGYKRFVFVNQFYYSNLESHINTFLENKDKDIIVYYHMPEMLLQKRDWRLDGITEYRTRGIRLIKCCNDFGMLTSFFQMMEDNPSDQPELILDPLLSRRPYGRYLSASQFGIPINNSFCRSTIFKFWEISGKLLNSIVFEQTFKKYLLPLNSLSEGIFTGDVISRFVPDVEQQDKVRTDFDNLIKNDYLYIDLDLQILAFQRHLFLDPVTEKFLEDICNYLKLLLNIKSIRGFINLVNKDHGLPVRQILTSAECESSNLEEVLYEALGNLQAIEELGIVSDWSVFFDTSPGSIAQGILRLVLEFLKPKTIRYEHAPFEKRRIRISNLIDTRNLCYNHIAVLNANEDSLPGSTQIPWLLSESQRRLLGLKTYEDIRLREKYYFFRFLLSSETAWIFYLENEDDDRQASSFLEELRLFLPSEMIVETTWEDNGYKIAYASLFEKKDAPGIKLPDRNVPEDFFHLKLETECDLQAGYYPLNYSQYAALRKNAFAAYLQYHAKLEELEEPENILLNEKMIGNIAHDFYRQCWDNVHQLARGNFFEISFLEKIWAPEFLQSRLALFMNKVSDLYFKLPHNYSERFFREILWQQLTDSTNPLIRDIRDNYHFDKIRPIPEKEKMTDEELQYKILFGSEDKDHGIGVKIRGRADLRVEEVDGRVIIIDYKTTQNETYLDRDQLLFYALFYYDLSDPGISESLRAFFYLIFMQKTEDLDKKERGKLLSEFFFRMDETMTELHEKGFALPVRKSGQDRFIDITRVDLKRMLGRN